jgi:AcrR family transcriptional regulator
MVQITHGGENIEKIKDILAAAQKRFGMFGLEKTSVSEIAADLNMSKGSIYYYFPDKESLYKAVIEKEHGEFLQKVKDQIQDMDNPVAMVQAYLKVNLQYFRVLLNLSRVRLTDFVINPMIKDIIGSFRKKEVELLSTILTKGSEIGVFNMSNPDEIANLYLDLLKGLRKMTIGKNEIFYLENEEYELMVQRINLFSDIFIKGLMYK